MGLPELLGRNVARFKRREFRELLYEGGYELYSASWRLGKLLPADETNVFDRAWDVLVVLDGCRVDLMREMQADYEFVGDVGAITSTGSMSAEWLEKTFGNAPRDELASTAYVTANLFSKDVCDEVTLGHLEEVWRDAWDDDANTIPARPVTDRAIESMRTLSPDRMIVHYMQPHHPFIADEDLSRAFNPDPFGRDNDGHGEARTAWDALRRGEVAFDDVWEAYAANLRYVLDDVALLRENVDAETMVLSADHGNAVGEWGIYGHPIGFPHPSVKRVPWVETTAEDTGSYVPEPRTNSTPVASTDERLAALGYT